MNTSSVVAQINTAGQSDRVRFALGIILSALSGIMLLLSFPPYGIWLLMWVGFVPFLFAQYRLMPFKWSSLAVALANLLWLGPFLARLFGTEVGFFFTYLGVWIAILSLLISKDRNFHEVTHYRWLVLSGIFSFVGFEMVRATFIPLVATSAFVGYTQAKQAWLIQPVSIFSVYGFDLLIMLVNYSIALGVISWFDRHWKSADIAPVDIRMARKWLMIAGGVLVTWIAVSMAMFNSGADQPEVRIAALRPNFPLPAFQDEVNTSQIRFDVFAEQAREAAAQGAQILYTPEMMFNFDPQVEFTEKFRDVVKETDTYIFVTYTVVKEGEPWRNEAVLLTPQGEFLDVYGKNHAFGEPPTAMNGVFPVYDTSLGRLATLICHDANYTDVARKLAGNGAQVISAPIREFGGFGEQYWTNALFRAVENQTAVVVTGVANISAIINPDGSLIALDSNANGSRVILVGDVTLGSHNALYTSLGDVLGWVSLAGFVFFMFFQSAVEKKAKKAAQSSLNSIRIRRSKMAEQTNVKKTVASEKVAMNKRFESVGWGLFLIMLGGFMFIPDTTVSKGLWSIGIGLIFLGLNAARYFNGIRMSGFTTFLGILSLIGGIVQLLGWKSMDGAFFLIILGAYLILKPWFDQRQLFGKAEHS